MLHTVNKPAIRLDAADKVLGKAKYGADLKFPHMLYAKGVYSAYPHAKILRIDTSEARRQPGAVCLITADDIPGAKVIGEVVQDQYVLAEGKVRFWGDVVAVAAAESKEQAEAAANCVKVWYEPLTALTDPAHAQYSEELVTDTFPHNICSACHTSKGDVEAGFEASDVIVETAYETQHVEHAYLEPEAIVVVPELDGKALTVYGSLQNPYMVRLSVCRTLNLPMAKVAVVQSTLGGTFGGKLESAEPLAVRAGLIALKTGRPVKYVLTREESIRESYKRHPFQFRMKLGATRDGTLCALKAQATGDSGAYVNMSGGVIWKTITLGPGPYRNPNVRYDAKAVMTNNVHTGSMRGFGTPQAIYAMENTMDELAEKLGISPLELRRRNILKTGDVSGCGQTLDKHTVTAGEVLEQAARAIGYQEKYERYNRENSGTLRHGVGLACSMRGASIGAEALDVARVYIEVEEDASVLVSCGYTEQGQGLRTAIAQIAAEALGCGLERITMNVADSSRAPSSGAAIASRGTYTGGNAVLDAAKQIKQIISEALCRQYGLKNQAFCFEGDVVSCGALRLSFQEAVALCYGQGCTPAAAGTFVNSPLNWDGQAGHGDAFATYTYSCHAAEVAVDLGTGQVKVIKMVGCHDAGRVINQTLACGQVFGGMVMGAGMGLIEDIQSVDGVIKNLNLDRYLIPTFLDVPDNEAILIDIPDPSGPYGAKSLGEPATEPAAAAVACAVNHALRGLGRLRKLPFDLESVFFCGKEGKGHGAKGNG